MGCVKNAQRKLVVREGEAGMAGDKSKVTAMNRFNVKQKRLSEPCNTHKFS